ncbi:tetratricopeptide repeat protein [Algirhabdus cladophorae]|uniref:tetratricopeptide repeat protein n=1 Tax=Algirhabdus cladophorae TaxID=3377108 RepID=UPI003B846DE0
MVGLLVLAGCESAEERAQAYYDNGVALIEAGDYDRAIVEFRNVFQLNGSHQEARHRLAELLRDHNNDPAGAYGQYLRLAEQYPDDLKARLELAEMAIASSNWEEATRHGTLVMEADPENPRVKILEIALGYYEATVAGNNSERRVKGREAAAMLEEQPDSVILRSMSIDNDLRNNDFDMAMVNIDWLIASNPENPDYWRQRLLVLAQQNDTEGLESQLRDMVVRFPDDITNKQTLIRFYMSQSRLDDAEAFLRDLVASSPEDNQAPRVDLIRFLSETQGNDAALVEIEAAIEQSQNPVPFRTMRAGMAFDRGEREAAVSELEDILASAGEGVDTQRIKVSLAQMMLSMGNEVGARAKVEEILAEDPNNSGALKMRAAWLIDADDVDGAVAALRTALDSDPDDAFALSLMSDAHARAGRAELAREFRALTVEASGNAPAESIQYAQLLIEEGRFLPAEDILLPSLRLNPRNVDLLVMLGRLYIAMDDLGRTNQVVSTLRQLETPLADQAAMGIEAQSINQQKGVDDAVAFLEGIAGAEDATMVSRIALVRARLATGNVADALDLAQTMLSEDPENEGLQGMVASVHSVNGNFEEAEAIYLDLLSKDPERPGVYLQLSQIKARLGQSDQGKLIIAEGLEVLPEDPGLLWAQASIFEADGNIDGAIDIYASLYERNSTSPVVANNLASLLSTYRDDAESLDQAWRIARRFKDVEVPAIQDTYGWIAQRRGDSTEAVEYLEAAAAGLPADPIVQYHLAVTYQALNRPAEALAQFEKAVDIAGDIDQRAQIIDARAQIEALKATVEN